MIEHEYDAVVIEFGGKGHLDDRILREMQSAPALAHARYPDAPLTLTLAGYDADPRSIWDIAEAAAYVRRYAKAAGLSDWRGALFQALDEPTKGLLIACDAIDKPHPFRLDIRSDADVPEEDQPAIRERLGVPVVPSITCPRCGFTSHNLGDIEQGYCARCHDWTRE